MMTTKMYPIAVLKVVTYHFQNYKSQKNHKKLSLSNSIIPSLLVFCVSDFRWIRRGRGWAFVAVTTFYQIMFPNGSEESYVPLIIGCFIDVITTGDRQKDDKNLEMYKKWIQYFMYPCDILVCFHKFVFYSGLISCTSSRGRDWGLCDCCGLLLNNSNWWHICIIF